MERLTKEQLQNISTDELISRFNILVQRMNDAHEELKNAPFAPVGFAAFDGSESGNAYVRIVDKLTRPFAATSHSDAGVKAIKVPY